MNARDKIAEPIYATSQLVRPRYSPGLLLQDEDLAQAVDYTRDLSRLLFRSFFGCGVICGLKVTVEEKCNKINISVEPGIALDCLGDPVHVKAPQTIVIDPTCSQPPDSMCVVIRRRDKSCAPRTSACASDDDESASAPTRILEGFDLRVLSECPECGCGCAPCESRPQTPPSSTTTPPAQPAQPLATMYATVERSNVTVAPPSGPPESGPQLLALHASTTTVTRDCRCADPNDPCYADHYLGKCSCCCESDWVSLARVYRVANHQPPAPMWNVDHSVRRFIRPVLMQDPLVNCTRPANVRP